MADKPKTDYNDILCQAIDTIVSKKIENLDYDKTIICDIVDASDASNGHYIVNDGSISFDAYSEDTGYKTSESVYVTVPKGDFTQTKIIISKYTANNGSDPISYVSPLNNTYLVTDNLVNGKAIRNNSILANGRVEEDPSAPVYYIPPGRYRLIWEQNLAANDNSIISNNAMFDTLAVKAKFKCDLGSLYKMKSGHYGLIYEIYSILNQDANPIEYRISRFDFNTDHFFGNPYMFLSYIGQEQTFDISSLGDITKINVYLYQSSDFKYRTEADVADKIVPTPAAGADLETSEGQELKHQEDVGALNNIFVDDLEIYFGMNLSKVGDNTFTIYTSSSSTFNVNQDSTYNTKTITPVWFNKTDDGKYIGFSDGIYDYLDAPSDLIGKNYTEDAYLEKATYYNSAMQLDQQALIDKGIPACKELLLSYAFGQKAQKLLDKLYSRITINLNRCYTKLKADLEQHQNVEQRAHTTAFFNNVIAANGAYGLLVTELETLKAAEDVNGSLMNIILTSLQAYGNKYTNRESILPANQSSNTFTSLRNIITTLFTKLENTEIAGCYGNTSYFTQVKGEINPGVVIIWENWYNSCREIFTDCEDILEQLSKIIGTVDSDEFGTIKYQLDSIQYNFNHSIYVDFETEYNDFINMYANRYCIYWYKYVDNYFDPQEKFMPKGWQRIEGLTNQGLPDEYFTGDTGDIMFAVRASKPSFTFAIGDPNLKQEQIQAILFYNHQQFKSNTLIFYNEEAVIDQTTKDAVDGLYIQLTDEILSTTQVDADGKPIVEQADTYNSKETYQLYDITNYLVNRAEAYKKRKIRARYQGGMKGDDYLKKDCIIYWYLPLNSTMLTYSREDLEAAGFSVFDPNYKPGFGSIRRIDYLTDDDYQDAIEAMITQTGSAVPAPPPSPFGDNYKEGYMMAWRTIDVDERDELIAATTEFIYQIKDYYVPTFTNNTIKCRVVKRSQYVYDAEQLFTFASLGTSGTDYSLTITPASNQAAVMDSQDLPLYVRLFDQNGDEITDTSAGNITIEIYGDSYNNYQERTPIHVAGGAPYTHVTRIEPEYDYGYAVIHATATVQVTYTKDTVVANNEPMIDSGYNTYTQTEYDNYVNTNGVAPPWKVGDMKMTGSKTDAEADEPVSKTITLESYYPIPWCKDPEVVANTLDYPQGYYIEGASVIVYDSNGQNPSYYKDPFVLYDMATNHRIPNQVWSIKCYPANDRTKTTLISSYMPKFKAETIQIDNNNSIINYRLQVSNMYLDNDKYVCSAVCKVNGEIVYVQPILIIKNRYSSPMLNAWDGELTIDKKNGTILSSMMGAGKKNNDNTFSGVLMGEVAAKTGDNAVNAETGLFGFNHGEQSFGLRDDGTAFFGKPGRGRIEFDGNKGEIMSSAYNRPDASERTGMKIDLDDAMIDMRGAYVFETQSSRWNANNPASQNNNEVNINDADLDGAHDDFINLTRYNASGSQVLIQAQSPFLTIKTPDVYYYPDEYHPGMSLSQVKLATYENFWKSISYYGGDLIQKDGETEAQFKDRKIDQIEEYLQCSWDIFDATEYYNTSMQLGVTTNGVVKNPATFLSTIVGKQSNGYFKVVEDIKSDQLGDLISHLVNIDGNGFVVANSDGSETEKILYRGDFLFAYMANSVATLANNSNLKLRYVPRNEARIDKITNYPDDGLPAFVKANGVTHTSVKTTPGSNLNLTLIPKASGNGYCTTVREIATAIYESISTVNTNGTSSNYNTYLCVRFLNRKDYLRCTNLFKQGTNNFKKESHTILEVGMDKYYLQTDNFQKGDPDLGYTDGQGLKFDLMKGSLEAYNFNLFAANPEDGLNSNDGTFVRLSSDGNPFFQIQQQGTVLMDVSKTKFVLRSQDWIQDESGTEIDLGKGKLTSYDFNLISYGRDNNDAVDKTTFVKLASGGNPYLQVRHEGKDLLNIGHSKFILQSKNWDHSNKLGVQIDLERGRITGYNFRLYFGNPANGNITIDSGASTYPIQLTNTTSGHVFRVSWLGEITAQAGTIGGWTIDHNNIYSNGNHNSNSNFRLSIADFSRTINSTSATELRLAIGTKFAVDKNGKLYASGVSVSGTITASAGYIGDWVIDGGGLRNSTNTIVINPTNLKYGSNFTVASNGNITAIGGTIGGWNINNTELSNGIIHLRSSGGNPIQVGNIFYVDSSGNLYATGGTLGNWTINNSNLSGGTLSGGTILGGTLDIGPAAPNIPAKGQGKFSVKADGSFSAGGGTFAVAVDGSLDINSNFKVNASGDVEKMGGINVSVKEIARLVVAGQDLSNSEYFVTIGATSPNANHWPKLTYQTSVLSYFNDASWVWGIVHESQDVESPVIGYVQYYKVNSTKGTSTVISGLAGTGYANNAYCSGISLKSLRSIDTIKVFSDTATVTHGGGTNGCFAKGTKIMISPFVYKNIEDIKEGETVLTYNTLFHTFESTNVIICNTYKNKQVYEIQFEDYSTIYTSSCHPFLDINNEWCAIDKDAAFRDHNIIAKTLTDKTILQQYKKNMKIKSIRKTNRIETLYDIGVNSYSHTYIANDCIVHNVFTPVQVSKS